MDDAQTSDKPEVEQPALSTPPVPEASFAMLENLLAMISSPGEFKRRLRGLHTALTAVDEGQARLEADRGAFKDHEARTRTELEQEWANVERRRVELLGAEQDMRNREAALATDSAALRRGDDTLKRRALLLNNIELNALQSTPSWPQIIAELGEARHPEQLELETLRPEGVPAQSTLAQTFYRSRKSARRGNQAEAS
jgi:hypothetical protein